jgi:subtilisin family serine protease
MNRIRAILSFLFLVLFASSAFGSSPSAALDPALRALLDQPAGVLSEAAAGRPSVLPLGLTPAVTAGDPPRLQVFLRAAAGRVPAGPGVEVVRLGGDLYGGTVTLEGLRRLVAGGDLASAHLSRPVRPALDRSTAFLGLNLIRRENPKTGAVSGYTGQGVLVGIADSGVDWNHPDFRNPDGTTRFAWFWDQTVPFARPPAGYPVGEEYGSRALNGGLGAAYDPSGHGTHVLGIAAGNGRGSFVTGVGSPYMGIAPEATLIGVRITFTELGVAMAAKYFFDKAEEMGMPAVLNLSVGNHYGPHLGDTPLENYLESRIGPGHLVVAAAGNDGDNDYHAWVEVGTGETDTLTVNLPRYRRDGSLNYVDFAGWFDVRNRYRFTVLDPAGGVAGVLNWGDTDFRSDGIFGRLQGWNTEDIGYGSVLVELADGDSSPSPAVGDFKLVVEGVDVGRSPRVDFWLLSWFNNRDREPAFVDHVDRRETVLSPATAPHILAVGAVSTRACWTDVTGRERCYSTPPDYGAVAYFSSLGPTADGRTKPEVLAPGFGVVSARSSSIDTSFYSAEEMKRLSTPDHLYWVNQGTSMAAPHATGTVALLLQRFPHMTYEQMVNRLTARSEPTIDSRTGEEDRALLTGRAVAPLVQLLLTELEPIPEGVRLRWFAGKSRGEAQFRVYKGFSDQGPFRALTSGRITGDNPYEFVDTHPEPGRTQVYRIAVADRAGLEEDLDTLRVDVAGSPVPTMRAPAPNPARGPVSVGFFLPPGGTGGSWRLRAYDVSGRRVAEAASGIFGPDGIEADAVWDLRRDDGGRVAAGMYFLRLDASRTGADGETTTRTFTRRVAVLP